LIVIYLLLEAPSKTSGDLFQSDRSLKAIIFKRVPAYPGFVRKNEFFPVLMPWAGLSSGVSFLINYFKEAETLHAMPL
jgi:hypothetical protein